MPNPSKVAQGALNWIRNTYPKAFADESTIAMSRANRTGNEHAVTMTDTGRTLKTTTDNLPHQVTPSLPYRRGPFDVLAPDVKAINAMLHTHPEREGSLLIAAPSDMDLLNFPILNRKGAPVRYTIASPHNNGFVDYARFNDNIPHRTDRRDDLYHSLQKYTNSDINGIEPEKSDVNLAMLRKLRDTKKARLHYGLEDEENQYFDEIYDILRNKLGPNGLKQGGLVQMKECNCGR